MAYSAAQGLAGVSGGLLAGLWMLCQSLSPQRLGIFDRTMTRLTLSVPEARKRIIHAQLLNSRNRVGRGVAATLAAIQQLGYVQLDTLHVVARAHHHTLWNRSGSYRTHHVDQLQRQGQVFEHWAHALAVLPMRDYRFSLPMMKRIASGDVHWFPKNKKEESRVLARIRAEGPLMARDFDDKPGSKAMWARAPSKNALEQLFMEGELMIPYRVNFHKVYDLRERVLPDDVDTRMPTTEELCRHLITTFLRAQSFGRVKHFAYLRKGLGKPMQQTLLNMQEEGEIIAVEIGGESYYALAAILDEIEQVLPPSGFRILSPFDNAVIQRERVSTLFDFDYQIECYVKKENRVYGYFCLPLLYRNKLVGRLDAKAERKSGVFQLLHLHLEKPVGSKAGFYKAFFAELKRFAEFNECPQLELQKVSGCNQARSLFRQYGV